MSTRTEDTGLADLLGLPVFPEDEGSGPRKLKFLGYFPCPIRAQIRDALHALVQTHSLEAGGGKTLPWYVPGGCGGIDVYEDLWKTEDEEALPELILSIDFGDFWRPEFQEKFVKKGLFEALGPTETCPQFLEAGLGPSSLGYSLFAVFPNILLVDLTRLEGRRIPESWDDLLDPCWEKDISLGGGKDEVSTNPLVYYWRKFGDAAMQTMSKNVKALRHSAKMAKLAGSGNPDSAALSILPWFFADSCPHSKNVKIVVPKEGAFVSPIYMLAKKNRSKETQALIDLLFSPEAAAICRQNWFPHVAGAGNYAGLDRSGLDSMNFSWLGWDFVENNDIRGIKDCLEKDFLANWEGLYE